MRRFGDIGHHPLDPVPAAVTDYRDLTDLQLMILNVLWRRRSATITEIHDEIHRKAGASRKTVGTLLSRLERRGLVRHRLDGREGVYSAAVPRRRVLVARVTSLLGAVFDGGKPALARAVDQHEVQPGDVARLRDLLRRAQRDLSRVD